MIFIQAPFLKKLSTNSCQLYRSSKLNRFKLLLFSLLIFFSHILADGNSLNVTLTTSDKELSRSCDGLGLYCSPQDGDTWAVNDVHLVRWNSRYPSIQTNGLVDIFLYISDNAREPILTLTNLPNKDGTANFKITRDNFYQFDPNADKRDSKKPIFKSAWFVIKASNTIDNDVTKGPNFNVVDPSPPLLKSSPTSSETPSPTQLTTIATTSVEEKKETSKPNPEPEIEDVHKQDSKALPIPIYGIVLISIGALIIFLIPIIFFIRKKRNKRNDLQSEPLEKSFIIGAPKGGAAGAKRLGSTSSAGFNAGGSRSSALTGDSLSPISLNPTNLTANDAIMLSETFREMMRKPSWSQNENMDTPELDEPLHNNNKESSARLEEELALDGVGLHELDSKKNLTIIHDLENDQKFDSIPSPSSSVP